MDRWFSAFLRVAALSAGAMALSACLTVGTSTGGGTTASTTADSTPTETAAVTPTYSRSSAGSLAVEPLDFDPAEAPRACVNDLRVYRTHLQMPAATRVDLAKPINSYIQEAGSPDAAIEAANAEINQLNQQLDLELARRNPFNAEVRRSADDAIATIEDGIMLNQALAEALECHR